MIEHEAEISFDESGFKVNIHLHKIDAICPADITYNPNTKS